MKFCFGVDIGGTTVKMGVFTEDAKLVDKWEIPTYGETVLQDVSAAISGHLSDAYPREDCLGIGIDVPGPVTDDGVVSECVNLGWGRVEVKKEVEALTGLPTFVGNDANVAALGELWQGGGKGYDSQVMITLGTGVGGGVIINGKIVAGAKGAGGEIGHIFVNYDETEKCNCGKCGCLEQYASATGIVRLAKRGLAAGKYHTSLSDIDNFSAKDVLDAAKAGDDLGQDVLDRIGWYLAVACSHLSQIVNPEVFVIGGGVSKAGTVILDAIGKYYDDLVMKSIKGTEFKLATLGNDAGIYGGAKMVIDGQK